MGVQDEGTGQGYRTRVHTGKEARAQVEAMVNLGEPERAPHP